MNWMDGLHRVYVVISIVILVYACVTAPAFGLALVELAALCVAMYAAGVAIVRIVRGFRQKDPQA